MPSPFPGMDPYLEDPVVFPDLHDRMIAYLSEALQAQLPEPYYAEPVPPLTAEQGAWAAQLLAGQGLRPPVA